MAAVQMEIEIPGVTAEQYDRLDERFGTRAGRVPDGLIHHAAMFSEKGLRVVDLWETQAQFEAFMAEMIQIMTEEGLPAPEQPPVFTQVYFHFERPEPASPR